MCISVYIELFLFSPLAGLIPMSIVPHAEKSIFSKAPRLTSANIDGKQTNQNSSVGTSSPCFSKQGQDAPCRAWSRITPVMKPAWAVWSFKCLHQRSMCHSCTLALCVCIFLHLYSAPSVLSHRLLPNHNYNVISRVRQCPAVVSLSPPFPFYEYQMLSRWALEAAQLFPRHTDCVCVCESLSVCVCGGGL